jgi:hypothetical protein
VDPAAYASHLNWSVTFVYTCEMVFWEYPGWTFGSTDQKLMLKNFVSSRLFLVPKRTAYRVTVIQRLNVSTLPEPSSPPRKRRSGRMDREDNLPPAA